MAQFTMATEESVYQPPSGGNVPGDGGSGLPNGTGSGGNPNSGPGSDGTEGEGSGAIPGIPGASAEDRRLPGVIWEDGELKSIGHKQTSRYLTGTNEATPIRYSLEARVIENVRAPDRLLQTARDI